MLDAASLFGIEVARPQTEARLRRTIAHAGYGQGEVLVSPLKMARVAAAVAHDGKVAADPMVERRGRRRLRPRSGCSRRRRRERSGVTCATR